MKALSFDQGLSELCQTYCNHHKKFGVFISVPEFDKDTASAEQYQEFVSEVRKACPPLNVDKEDPNSWECDTIAFFGGGLLLFDTREEQQAAYWSIVGDDGPTKTNPYDGPMRVYALTISNLGNTENENT